MASQTPVILADNVFDRINLYVAGSLSALYQAPGREVNYVADYRRERTYWQASGPDFGSWILADVGAGNLAQPDMCWIDRGHNLWGKTVNLYSQDQATVPPGVVQYIRTLVVPAAGTLGGDPLTGWCVTEEGAIYTIFSTFVTPNRFFYVSVSELFTPLITGVILGKRTQMLNYSSILDEDEGERIERQENSNIPGYYGRDRSYSGRKLRVQLATIGAAEYDAQIRTLRRFLFEKDQPFFCVMNYGTKPERGWLYQYQGAGWSAPTERVYRRHSFVAQELGPLIR